MRILELTNYTQGGCGVGKRVMAESVSLSKMGHQITICSSNHTKGSLEIAKSFEKRGKINIYRFPAIKIGGESFLYWNFEQIAYSFKPEIIIAHAYRHIHTLKALAIGRKLSIPVILVTHAPFARSKTRSFFSNIAVKLYDRFIGQRTISQFRSIVYISEWEVPYLIKLGVNVSQLEYLPNGVYLDKFNSIKKNNFKKVNNLIYTGRISPIKSLETVINSLSLMPYARVHLFILGPAEKDYLLKINSLIEQKKVSSKVTIIPKEYDLSQQLIFFKKGDFFIQPSISEGIPQTLIEAMAAGKIPIVSDNLGNSEIVTNEYNGFVYSVGNEIKCAAILKKVFNLNESQRKIISLRAKNSIKKYDWKIISIKLDKLLNKLASKESNLNQSN